MVRSLLQDLVSKSWPHSEACRGGVCASRKRHETSHRVHVPRVCADRWMGGAGWQVGGWVGLCCDANRRTWSRRCLSVQNSKRCLSNMFSLSEVMSDRLSSALAEHGATIIHPGTKSRLRVTPVLTCLGCVGSPCSQPLRIWNLETLILTLTQV